MSQTESSAPKEIGIRVEGSHSPQARMFDSWMSARKELRDKEIVPPRLEVLPHKDEEPYETLRPLNSLRGIANTEAASAKVAPEATKPEVELKPAALAQPIAAAKPATLEVAKEAPARPALKALPQAPAAGTGRKLEVVRSALVMAQKLLPLLEGNVMGTVSNLLTPSISGNVSRKELAAIQETLKDLEGSSLVLDGKLGEQGRVVQRLVDRLDLLKEAVDRNTLEQQELTSDARALRKKVAVMAWIGMFLLVAAVVLDVVVVLRVFR